jgi:transposase-like protein
METDPTALCRADQCGDAMRRHEFNAVIRAIQEMSWPQRRQLMVELKSVQAGEEAHRIVEERVQWLATCPHCCGLHVVRNGMARGLQRYKCRDCGRSFNALTGTPLARLRYRERWLDQAQALIDALSITKASQHLHVARSTAFRWRHRFLALPHHIKVSQLGGIVEADETCMLKSCKGQPQPRRSQRRKPRRRGGRATIRGMSKEHDIVLVVRDRSGACTDPVLCTDGSGALAAAARHLEVEHHAINLSAGHRVIGPWHINNVNGYHGRLKNWLRRFKGVASAYLSHYLGWFRALDRFKPTNLTPSAFLALSVGL